MIGQTVSIEMVNKTDDYKDDVEQLKETLREIQHFYKGAMVNYRVQEF